MANKACLARLRKELRAFDPPPYIRAVPLESNIQVRMRRHARRDRTAPLCIQSHARDSPVDTCAGSLRRRERLPMLSRAAASAPSRRSGTMCCRDLQTRRTRAAYTTVNGAATAVLVWTVEDDTPLSPSAWKCALRRHRTLKSSRWRAALTLSPGSSRPPPPLKSLSRAGKLKFPDDFPFRPPSIFMITPNGRFETNRRLCLSISDFHPETWVPTWSVSQV